MSITKTQWYCCFLRLTIVRIESREIMWGFFNRYFKHYHSYQDRWAMLNSSNSIYCSCWAQCSSGNPVIQSASLHTVLAVILAYGPCVKHSHREETPEEITPHLLYVDLEVRPVISFHSLLTRISHTVYWPESATWSQGRSSVLWNMRKLIGIWGTIEHWILLLYRIPKVILKSVNTFH